ncbi:MAG: nuclease [Rhodoblastus sp.]|nr:nuclease [Rhodoblastus sp.]
MAAAAILAALLPGAARACVSDQTEAARIAIVEDNFDILLADGRVAVLAGFAPEPAAPGYGQFRERLAGAAVRLAQLEPKPDRWGRIPAWISTGSEEDAGLAGEALAAGLGRYRPDPAARPCRARLLATEQAARAARRGLWDEPKLGVLDAADAGAALAAAKGYLVLEGRILTIGERRGRLYLNFGARRTTDFSIVISKRNAALIENAGLPLRKLGGRRLRARGLLDRGFGPLMEITSADALELLDDLPGAAEMKR